MRSREQLFQDTEPFPDALIKKLPPRGDSYVKWQQYAQRLLLHHPEHSWRVSDIVYQPGYLYPVKDGDGKLTDEQAWAPPVWAVSGELDLGDGNVYAGVGEDDAPASAESNAYKRAAAHAGIGLHLYGDYWLHGRLEQGDE